MAGCLDEWPDGGLERHLGRCLRPTFFNALASLRVSSIILCWVLSWVLGVKLGVKQHTCSAVAGFLFFCVAKQNKKAISLHQFVHKGAVKARLPSGCGFTKVCFRKTDEEENNNNCVLLCMNNCLSYLPNLKVIIVVDVALAPGRDVRSTPFRGARHY